MLLIFILLFGIFYGFLVRQGLEARLNLEVFHLQNFRASSIFFKIAESFLRALLKPNPLKLNDAWDEKELSTK